VDLVYDRAVGSLVGLAIGDALGASVHYQKRDTFEPVTDLIGGGPFKLEPGGWTDSTAMALALADSLISCNKLDELDFLTRLRAWYEEGKYSHTTQCIDINKGMVLAMKRFAARGDIITVPSKAGKAMHDPITRLAPIAIFFNYSVPMAIDAAYRQSNTTHSFALCLNTCQRMTFELIVLYNGVPFDRIESWKDDQLDKQPRDAISSEGLVDTTHKAAKWALRTTDNFKDAVLLAANLGDECDAIAAVAGQYAGATYGLAGIPKEWVEKLIWKDYILELAEKLYYEED